MSTKTPSEVEELLARSLFYQLLSHLFRHPSLNPLRQLEEEMNRIWQENLASLDISFKGEIGKSLTSLFEGLSKISDESWVSQYERVFGHTPHGRVPAYELEYGEEHSHRQPPELADISAYYQAFGLKISKDAFERGDHVSLECEFMGFILYKSAYALEHHGPEKAEICKEAAFSFLKNHLGRWLPALTLRLSKAAPEGLMSIVSDLAFYFVIADCSKLGIQPGPRDLPIRKIQEKLETGCISCLESARSMI